MANVGVAKAAFWGIRLVIRNDRCAQLGLNALWSWMFFGLNSTALGLVNIIPQLAMILLTIVLFHRLDGVAAWCLSPLVVWVGYATLLNASLWWLNG